MASVMVSRLRTWCRVPLSLGFRMCVLLLFALCACSAPQDSLAPTDVSPNDTVPAVTSRPTREVQLAGELVRPEDLVYVGAFRLPGDEERPRTFAYGGNAMTFNPDNGTLFVMGHDRLAYGDLPDGNQIAEVGIPEPVVSRVLADLPCANFVQDFHDVTAGYFRDLEEIPRVGMAYLNHPATGAKIHLGWGAHLQMERVPSQAWFNSTLSAPDLQGLWFIDELDPYLIDGYLFEIPAAWADVYASGRYLATGRMRDGGQASMGPTLFAYRPWLEDGSAPPNRIEVQPTTLLRYASVDEADGIDHALDGYQHPDEWEGGAWLTTGSGASAVIFAGTKATGAKYWYGWANPTGPEIPCVEDALVGQFTLCRLADGTPCPEEDLRGCNGHNDYRGWWSSRFDAQIIFYDPADLAKVASGELASWDPQPYAVLDIDEHLYFSPPEWDLDDLGRGDQRRMRIGDVAYDRERGRLYVIELYADGAMPVIHAWQVQ